MNRSVLLLSMIIFIRSFVRSACPDKCTCSVQSLPEFANVPGVSGPHVDCRNKSFTSAPFNFDKDAVFINLDNNNIPHLEILDLNGNTMNLKHIQAKNSQIEDVIKIDADFLTHLVLKSNKLRKIPLTSRTLQYLHLSDNNIAYDSEQNLLFYFQLKRLELTDNKLLTIPLVPNSIQELFLTHNQITFVDSQLLRSLPNLNLLALEYNKLFKINLPEAYFMTRIPRLFIEDNPNLIKDESVERWCTNDNITSKICSITTEK